MSPFGNRPGVRIVAIGPDTKPAGIIAVESPPGHDGGWIGFNLAIPPGTDRRSFIRGALAGFGAARGIFGTVAINLKAPCGAGYAITADGCPLVDTICLCGNPAHVVVRWTEAPAQPGGLTR